MDALNTTIDLDGMHDLIEIRMAQLSWDHAEMLNEDARSTARRFTHG